MRCVVCEGDRKRERETEKERERERERERWETFEEKKIKIEDM